MIAIISAAGGLGTRTTAALVVRIRFAAVEGTASSLGPGFVFFGLEAAGESFVGGGVLGGGVGVVRVEFFVCWVGASTGVGRGAGWRCDGGFGGDFVLGFAGDGVYVVAGWVGCESGV